jgi:hypothetical protein
MNRGLRNKYYKNGKKIRSNGSRKYDNKNKKNNPYKKKKNNNRRYRNPMQLKKYYGNRSKKKWSLPNTEMKKPIPDIYEYDQPIAKLGQGSIENNVKLYVNSVNDKKDITVENTTLKYLSPPVEKYEELKFIDGNDDYNDILNEIFLPQEYRLIYLASKIEVNYEKYDEIGENKEILEKIRNGSVDIKTIGLLNTDKIITKIGTNIDKFYAWVLKYLQELQNKEVVKKLDEIIQLKNKFSADEDFAGKIKEVIDMIKDMKYEIKEVNLKKNENRLYRVNNRYWRYMLNILNCNSMFELIALLLMNQKGIEVNYGNIGGKKKFIVIDEIQLFYSDYFKNKQAKKPLLVTPVNFINEYVYLLMY